MPYPPAYPHDPIEEIAADLFMVRGSIRMNALCRTGATRPSHDPLMFPRVHVVRGAER